MNSEEIKQWIGHHDAAFPGFRKWANQSDVTTQQIRLTLWTDTLKNCSLTDAADASSDMFNGGIDMAFGRHVGWVRRWVAENRAEDRFNGRCELCNDSGIVSVQFHEPRKTFAGNPLPDNIGQAACKCTRGDWVNQKREDSTGGTKLEPFDSATMTANPRPAFDRSAVVGSLRQGGNLKLARIIEGFGLSQ